jgi:hypothetical protein
MKLKALKDLNWSIDRKAVKFEKDSVFDVNDKVANDMINAGAAELVSENKAQKPNKKTLVEENKAIEETDENKESEESEEKAPKKAAKSSKKSKK